MNQPVARENSRQRRQQETRQAILAAAQQCFCELGYADCSIDRVAATAGFTKGAVYGQFDSKEDLFLALIEARSNAFLAEVLDALPDQASGEVLVHAMGQWLARRLDEEREWCLVMAEFAVLAARRPALGALRRDALRRSTAELANVLERVVPGAAVDPDRALAGRLILSLADGLAMHHAIDDELDVASAFSLGVRRLSMASPPTPLSAKPVKKSTAGRKD